MQQFLSYKYLIRFYKGGGVTQPSQRRYVAYFGELLKNWKKTPILKNLLSVNLSGVPKFSGKKGCRPFIEIYNVRENKLVIFLMVYGIKYFFRFIVIEHCTMSKKNMKKIAKMK